MSIFQNEQVSKAFNELCTLAANGVAIAATLREDLGDEDFKGARDADTANIERAIADLQAAFLEVSETITYDDIAFAAEQIVSLEEFTGAAGGTRKDWDKYLIALEAMVEARPDLKPRCVLRAELAKVAGLQGAKVTVPSVTYIRSGVEIDDPRPAAVRAVLERFDAKI